MRRRFGRRKRGPRPKRGKQFLRLLRVLLPLVFVLGFFFFLITNERFLITGVVVTKAETTPEEGILDLVNTRLKGRYLFVVPKNNILLYPRSLIKRDVLEHYPAVKDVSTSFDRLRTLNLSITEREAAYVWCPRGGPRNGRDTWQCYLTDEGGIAFRDASSVSRSAYLTFFGTWVNASSSPDSLDPTGSLVLNPRDLKIVNSFKDFLLKEGVTIDEVSLSPEEDYTFRVRGGGKLYLARSQTIPRVTENLLAALTAEEFLPYRGKLKEVLPRLEYLDLRFDKKIFYMWKK